MIDLDAGWVTERLDVEPLVVAHAAELAALLDDARLHEFIGGEPLRPVELAARFERLAGRRSADGSQLWGNWVLRRRDTGLAVGTVQATLPSGGPSAGPAEIAWVVASAAQGHGFAKEAARGLADLLAGSGWTVIAHVHPGHVASQRVAAAAGLTVTEIVQDGEQRWARA